MPVDYSIYPPNWDEIRSRILKRADNACEGSPVYPGCRAANSMLHPVTHSRVVLTIAHLDHNPENWDVQDDRLRAWCQRCHLRYDQNDNINRKKYGKGFNKNQQKLEL